MRILIGCWLLTIWISAALKMDESLDVAGLFFGMWLPLWKIGDALTEIRNSIKDATKI